MGIIVVFTFLYTGGDIPSITCISNNSMIEWVPNTNGVLVKWTESNTLWSEILMNNKTVSVYSTSVILPIKEKENIRMRSISPKFEWSDWSEISEIYPRIEYGNCDDSDTAIIHYNINIERWASSITHCAKKCFGQDSCTSTCIVKAININNKCAACIGSMVECARNKCIADCAFDPNTSDCLACASLYCDPSTIKCTGLPMQFLH